jgi:hypothetical protein
LEMSAKWSPSRLNNIWQVKKSCRHMRLLAKKQPA